MVRAGYIAESPAKVQYIVIKSEVVRFIVVPSEQGWCSDTSGCEDLELDTIRTDRSEVVLASSVAQDAGDTGSGENEGMEADNQQASDGDCEDLELDTIKLDRLEVVQASSDAHDAGDRLRRGRGHGGQQPTG